MTNPELSSKTPALTVGRLSLTAFRNYASARLETSPGTVLLTGPNGSGKTNLLEALSLFVPGRGLRRARLSDLQSRSTGTPWAVAAEMEGPQGALKLGTGRDPEGPAERRLIRLDERPIKNQALLATHVAMVWVTPEMDRVLTDSPSARRRLLDRMVFDADPAHAGRVQRYEKAMRERSRLLREGRRDPAWLSALEDEMARTGTAIAAARQDLLGRLLLMMTQASPRFPKADLTLRGAVEEHILERPALLVEDEIRSALASSRASDATSGSTSIGPHRSDLVVEHAQERKPIHLCSTGEQKALVIAVMLSYGRYLAHLRGFAPLLLLDDIASHLDAPRRSALFEEIKVLGSQAWITGTDEAFFAPHLNETQRFKIEGGVIS